MRKIWSFHGNLDSSAIDRDISELLPFHYDWDIIGLWKPKTWETFVMLHWTFFFDGCQDKINKFSNQLVILVFGSVQPLLSACLGFPQDRPSGLLPFLLSLLLCGALCRKLYNWVVSHQKRTRPWSHQCHQREGGGVRVQVEWRALGEAGQWSLCATWLLLHSVPLVVGDGAIVLAAPLLESDKISFQIVREA